MTHPLADRPHKTTFRERGLGGELRSRFPSSVRDGEVPYLPGRSGVKKEEGGKGPFRSGQVPEEPGDPCLGYKQ